MLDIGHRIISLENARKPADYYETFVILAELGIITPDFAHLLAPLAGLRNILVHEYLQVDWDLVYQRLNELDTFVQFRGYIQKWLSS